MHEPSSQMRVHKAGNEREGNQRAARQAGTGERSSVVLRKDQRHDLDETRNTLRPENHARAVEGTRSMCPSAVIRFLQRTLTPLRAEKAHTLVPLEIVVTSLAPKPSERDSLESLW